MSGEGKSTFSLEQRPRLMALVFALRLILTGMSFALISVICISLNLTADKEIESLALLFSYFVLLIATILCVIRFSRNLSRFLVLSPILAFFVPSLGIQVIVIWFTGLLFLEGFRYEASPFGPILSFRIAQSVWFFGASLLGLLPPGFLPLTLGLLSLLISVLFSYSCWKWQIAIKSVMTSLD